MAAGKTSWHQLGSTEAVGVRQVTCQLRHGPPASAGPGTRSPVFHAVHRPMDQSCMCADGRVYPCVEGAWRAAIWAHTTAGSAGRAVSRHKNTWSCCCAVRATGMRASPGQGSPENPDGPRLDGGCKHQDTVSTPTFKAHQRTTPAPTAPPAIHQVRCHGEKQWGMAPTAATPAMVRQICKGTELTLGEDEAAQQQDAQQA